MELAIIPQTTNTTLAGAAMTDLAGQLSPKSQRKYREQINYFLSWLESRGLDLQTVSRSDFIQYRAYLDENFSKATANSRLTIARRLFDEAVNRNELAVNPAKTVKGFKTDNESPHRALQMDELRRLLKSFDLTTNLGRRDYALVSLLVRTGIRRAEAAALVLGDLKLEQGHNVLVIRHGKGDKRRVVKLPVDVKRAIDDYLKATARTQAGPDAPLFCQFDKGDHPVEAPITDKTIERRLLAASERAGLGKLTPHDLRASFVTLSLEGGAALHQVQYAAGHASPVTTERYQRRKLNLDNNAVDFIKP